MSRVCAGRSSAAASAAGEAACAGGSSLALRHGLFPGGAGELPSTTVHFGASRPEVSSACVLCAVVMEPWVLSVLPPAAPPSTSPSPVLCLLACAAAALAAAPAARACRPSHTDAPTLNAGMRTSCAANSPQYAPLHFALRLRPSCGEWMGWAVSARWWYGGLWWAPQRH